MAANTVDDTPVGTKLSFEQLLERELKKQKGGATGSSGSGPSNTQSRSSAADAGKPKKRPFLKRGEGLKRFNMSPKSVSSHGSTPGSDKSSPKVEAIRTSSANGRHSSMQGRPSSGPDEASQDVFDRHRSHGHDRQPAKPERRRYAGSGNTTERSFEPSTLKARPHAAAAKPQQDAPFTYGPRSTHRRYQASQSSRFDDSESSSPSLRGAHSRRPRSSGAGASEDDVSEASFLMTRSNWERIREQEQQELEEFEQLEQILTPSSLAASSVSNVSGRRRQHDDHQPQHQRQPQPQALRFDDDRPWDTPTDHDVDSASMVSSTDGTVGDDAQPERHGRSATLSYDHHRGHGGDDADSDVDATEEDVSGDETMIAEYHAQTGHFRHQDDVETTRSDSRTDSEDDIIEIRARDADPVHEFEPGASDASADEQADGSSSRYMHAPPKSRLVERLFSRESQKKASSSSIRHTGKMRGHSSVNGTPHPSARSRSRSASRASRHAERSAVDTAGKTNGEPPTRPQRTGDDDPVLKAKLAELEEEIARFRDETAALSRLRAEKEHQLGTLKAEIAEFERQKQQDHKAFEEYKAAELAKLKKERNVYRTHREALAHTPSREAREEIAALQEQVAKLQSQLREQEQRSNSTIKRYADRIRSLTERNKELEDEVAMLERARLQHWRADTGSSAREKQSSSFGIKNTGVGLSGRKPQQRNPPDAVQPSVTRLASKGAENMPVVDESAIRSGRHAASVADDENQPLDEKQAPAEAADEEDGDSQGSLMSSDLDGPSEAVEPPLTVADKTPRLERNKMDARPSERHVNDTAFQPQSSLSGSKKIEEKVMDGRRIIVFANGTRKEILPNGEAFVQFFNGDTKRTFPDGRVIYFYVDANTTHETQPDGTEILKFANGQLERHYPDGVQEIQFPEGTVKYVFPSGEEETIFPDGTIQRISVNGDKFVDFPNGQKEVHTDQFAKRRYPDGTVKIVYSDGRQETQYANGRVRIRDSQGNLVLDTGDSGRAGSSQAATAKHALSIPAQ